MTTRRYRHLPSTYVLGLCLLVTVAVSLFGYSSVRSHEAASPLPFTAAPTQSPLMPNVNMHIDFGFAGRFRPGYWTPVRVTLVADQFTAEAKLVTQTLQGSPISGLAQSIKRQHHVTLPPGTPVTVDMVMHLANAFHPLRFDLLDNTGRLLSSETLDLQRRTIDGDFMVALDDSAYRWSWLETHLGTGVSARGERLGFEVVYVARPQHLPTSWLAYHGVTAVGISSGFALDRLAPAQADALTHWVTAGGHLVWTGGSSLGATAGLLVEQLAPVTFSGRTVSFHQPTLGEGYAPLPADTPLIMWETAGAHPTAHVLAGTSVQPLISRHRVGRGTVFFTAFDPYVLASRDWVSSGSLSRDMLSGARTLRAGLGEAEATVWRALEEQNVTYPGQAAAAVIALVYVLLLAVMWARRGDVTTRKTLGMTVAAAVLFTALPVFVVGPAARRSRHVALTVSTSLVDSRGIGESWHFRGLRSAVAERWPLTDGQNIWTPGMGDLLATSPVGPEVTFVWDDNSSATVQLAPQHSLRLQSVSPAALCITTELLLQGRQYRLSVTNNTTAEIEHLFYVSATDVVSLGALAPGTSMTHAMSSTLRSSEPLSADWLSRNLLSQLNERGLPRAELIAQTMAALVQYRYETGNRGSAADDGFVIGVFAPVAPVFTNLPVSGANYHIVVADVSLQASAGKG